MKILIASETYPPDVNGAAIFTERLATELSKNNDVVVLAPGKRFKDEVEYNGSLKIFRLKSASLKPFHPSFRMIYKVGLNERVKKIIRGFKPDIIHIQNHFSLGKACLSAASKLDIPIIGTNHFMPENLLQYFPAPLKKHVAHHMWSDFIKVYNRLDYVTAPTKAAIEMVIKKGLKNTNEVISNGIDLNKFRKIQPDEALLKKYGIQKRVPVFLFVGRLEVDKNIDVVLKALKIALKKRDIQLVIVGKGKNEIEFKALAKKLDLRNRVIFTGKVSDGDLHGLYNSADVYIGSGTAELQGLSVMEAMVAHLPVLAVDAVALPELVTDQVNGFLFKNDEKDLADKMLKILEDRNVLKNMEENSYAAIKKHDIKKTISAFYGLYERIIESRKGQFSK